MLRPFKSFLNNLQKNAIGATIFGILPDMTNNPEEEEEEEDEEEIVSENMYNSDVVDPLTDPLAIDDVMINQTDENGSDFTSGDTTLTDLDSSGEAQIILVDVNSLKNAFPITIPAVSYEICSSNTDNVAYGMSSSNSSSSSSCIKTSSVYKNDNGINAVPDNYEEVGTSLALNVSGDDGIGVTFEPIALALDDEIIDEIEGVRSDGSDSGLGLELSAGLLLDKTNASSTVVEPTAIETASAAAVSRQIPSLRSNLKRRSDPTDQIDVVDTKKPKRNIQFNGVTVYYFPRIQGFTCIPSQGGCTLGMGPRHYDEKSYSLSEHMAEQKRIHRQQMLEGLKTRSPLPTLPPPLATIQMAPVATATTTITPTMIAMPVANAVPDDQSRSSTEESEESEEEVLSDNSSSELDTETIGFLQPVSQRQRRALLKAAGVREIASYEKNECRDIRASREFCGCNCRDYCDPETCFCSQSGIKCQVDRASFPCGCTQDGCANRFGRIEFNPKRVRTHFIHTLMRLELEKKQKKSEKQNGLNTYDGRLRLRDSDDDSSSIAVEHIHSQQQQHPQHNTGLSLGHLVNYNPSNNLIYPASMSTATSSAVGDMVDGHLQLHCNNNSDFGGNSTAALRNTGNGIISMPESPLDLHYAFKNDYQVDIASVQDHSTPSFTMYSNPSYFSSTSGTTNFNDYSSLSSTAQPNEIASTYAPYTTNLSYTGLMSNDTIINNVTAACPPYIDAYSHDNVAVSINSALFDGSHDDDDINVLRINSISSEKNLSDLNSLLDGDSDQQITAVDDVLNKLEPTANVEDAHLLLELNENDVKGADTPNSFVQNVNSMTSTTTMTSAVNREFVTTSVDESVPVPV